MSGHMTTQETESESERKRGGKKGKDNESVFA